MTYTEFIDRALHGRSVNKAAHDMGITQTLLNKYKLGTNLPGFLNALILAKAAGVTETEALRLLAEEEASRKGLAEKLKELFNYARRAVKSRRR